MLEGTDLARHVGHQVQVTGTITAAGGGATGTSATTGGATTGGGTTGGATTATTGAMNDTRLRVTSVMTLAENCPNQ